METTHSPHLPTEILVIIADMLWLDFSYDPRGMSQVEKQNDFWSFCLVSRQWYSVGISYLYRFPQLWLGNKFAQFTNTVSPPLGAKKSKVDLGSLVEFLYLGTLVHQSSNSQTSRLLSRVKEGLTYFIAPQTGIGVNSLASISKCRKLQHLDLSLVLGGAIEFPRLKKTVSNLQELVCLKLPSSMEITRVDDSVGEWPPNLSSMTVGGILDFDTMSTFEWPPNINELELKRCKNLDTLVFEGILLNEQLQEKLTTLRVYKDNANMFSDSESIVLYSLQKLTYLQIPLDFLEYLNIVPSRGVMNPLPLRILELTSPYFDDELGPDFAEELQRALSRNLRNLWALGIGESSLPHIEGAYKQIDDEIWKHVEESSDDELDKLAIEDLGIYTIDDDPMF